MRYALIMAGGSGTRLWPMSRGCAAQATDPFHRRQEPAAIGLRSARRADCRRAALRLRRADAPRCDPGRPAGTRPQRFLGEPVGRDTLNAVGLDAAVLAPKIPTP